LAMDEEDGSRCGLRWRVEGVTGKGRVRVA